MRGLSIATAAALAAVVLFLALGLPPGPRRFSLDGGDSALQRRTLRGSYHVHTTRSDGAEGKAAVAAAAARVGLQFVIFTDHGDGRRMPDPPQYLDGVLCLDGVEISTNHGHYIALGLGATPYPLGGDASTVVEDIARFGGFGIAAHPFHPKKELTWTEWNLPIDGIEWVNADVEWRNESAIGLARAFLSYLVRPGAALASVFDRPTEAMARWDQLSATRPIVGLAGADAHGSRLGMLEEGKRSVIPGPRYEASFGALTNRIVLDQPLYGDPARDAQMLIEAIRAGRTYVVLDGLADGVLLAHGPDGFSLSSPLPAGGEVRTVRSGERRRLEIDLAGAPGRPPMPWVVSNWTGPAALSPSEEPTVAASGSLELASEWRVEKDPASTGSMSADGQHVTLDYRLAPEGSRNQFVGAVADLPAGQALRRLTVGGRSSRPMRVSVQLRFPPDDERWVKSIYLDEIEREFTFDVGAMSAADHSGRPAPARSPRSILFVIDLVNAEPGSAGSFTLQMPRVERTGR